MYNDTRQEGFGEELKKRVLMGTYALSAGYYDAYYKKAQQVTTLHIWRLKLVQTWLQCKEHIDAEQCAARLVGTHIGSTGSAQGFGSA